MPLHRFYYNIALEFPQNYSTLVF